MFYKDKLKINKWIFYIPSNYSNIFHNCTGHFVIMAFDYFKVINNDNFVINHITWDYF